VDICSQCFDSGVIPTAGGHNGEHELVYFWYASRFLDFSHSSRTYNKRKKYLHRLRSASAVSQQELNLVNLEYNSCQPEGWPLLLTATVELITSVAD